MTYPRFREPRPQDLEGLERIAARRSEIESVRAADVDEAELRRFLLATLDRMEEAVCRSGAEASAVRRGWKLLADFESFGRNGHRDHRDHRR